MVIKRGEIWWARLRPPRGSEPGFRRPILIVQCNEFNKSRIQTVIAAILTSNLRLKDAPGNVFLPARITRLPRDSVANLSQIVTLDKSYLIERVHRLSPEKQMEIDQGLRLVLNLK